LDLNAAGGAVNLNSGAISNLTLHAAGGAVNYNLSSLAGLTLADGTLNLNSTTTIPGATTTVNSGASLNVGASQTLRMANNAVLTNNGTVKLNSGSARLEIYNPSAAATVTLAGTGRLVLASPCFIVQNSNLYARTLINDTGHTIEGGGTLYDINLTNRGTILANNGPLYLYSTVTQEGAGRLQATGAGNILRTMAGGITGGSVAVADGGEVYFNGGSLSNLNVNAAGGTVGFGSTAITFNNFTLHAAGGTAYSYLTSLAGLNLVDGTLNLNNPVYIPSGVTTVNSAATLSVAAGGYSLYLQNGATLTNNGTVLINQTDANFRVYNMFGPATATIGGTGHLVLGPGNSIGVSNTGYAASLTNDAGHTIEGGGTVQAPVINRGSLIANNQTLAINSPVSGNGLVSIANGATLQANQNVQCGNFQMAPTATFQLASNMRLEVQGNFSFEQTDTAKWSLGTGSALYMPGNGIHSLEVGGLDTGPSPSGFVNNFNWPRLRISDTGNEVWLVDDIDNGHRGTSGKEALYVSTLEVLSGATLNLHGLHLYTYLGQSFHLVTAGEGSLFGGGVIVDHTPVPGSVLLLGSGLVGLLAARRLRRKG
jgi:hypothetical protein